jgi:hypothetical protein
MNWLQAGMAAALMCLPMTVFATNTCADGESPEGVWKCSYEALHKGDIAEMRKYLTKERRAEVDRQDAKTQGAQLEMLRTQLPKDARVVDKKLYYDGRKATLKVRGTGNSGQVPADFYGTIEMVKEGDGWKVGEQGWGATQPGARP